jgi:PhzF family phenazine biosynthesis protein
MEILRYAAFSPDPRGGNPAGVVLDAGGASEAEMLRVAAEVGYSETAFLVPGGEHGIPVRYFSPQAEVPFCGHATIAAAAAYAGRHGAGELLLSTKVGPVRVLTTVTATGVTATLTSVPPKTVPLDADALAELLELLGWAPSDLDPGLPPRVAYAGAWHPVIAAVSRDRLSRLDYDLPSLAMLMARQDWTTINLVWREAETVFHCRNPFPPGGVFEDPATGAAAAALGGYLREFGLVSVPAEVTVRQGQDMGRPSLIIVGIPAGEGGIDVTGAAVAMA